jgi:EAL domain-containing protein (putative c-di-GMP-specific phosphodiesterase class I)
VALWRGDPQTDAHELLKRSDMAMYEAKKAGRNAARFFDPIMQTAIESRARMEGRLRTGLNLGQFRLHYQRQVRSGGSVYGAEALLRWQDPERGMVSPGEFIPLAEESDLIMPIGRWVLETACRQIKAWSHAEGTRGLRLSVNISPKQFGAEWFVNEIAEILRDTGADASLLQLEITEGMLLTDIEETITKMTQLRKLGVSFALDDFGTGYSSLFYLQRLPLNVLKIDQSFVQDLGLNARSEAIVRTVIQMSRSLGLDVLAEGVETEAQRQVLAQWGCTNYQGYLFGRPVPIESFAREP